MTLCSRLSPQGRSLASVALILTVALVIYWTGRPQAKPTATQQLLQGSTMGTTYTIRYLPVTGSQSLLEMHQLIDHELKQVNQQMSTYLKDSEITRFNDSMSTDWFPVSVDTAQVVELAQQVSVASEGAFDVTVGPLVNLWGFGPDKRIDRIPSNSELEAAKAVVGYQHLSVRLDPPALKKSLPMLRVDLSAIAKGHGSDRVGKVIGTSGITNYFVEIGGEIVAQGTRVDGQPWQVGIEAPMDFERSIQTVIGLSGRAIATSGDYRNFFEKDGQRFSHTIDPSTGRPVTHQLASASVVADNCALADAIATCMMALGPDKGLQLAEVKDWAVLLMRRSDGRMLSVCSTRFAQLYPDICTQLSVAN